MKKSKFLQNSKDMLSRSFNPAKCKTSLRLAMSRMKLMRNKKDVQVKQMKREISQLLESGQDRTARIRVDHVVREEKMMAAYDLLEIYCELIVARLPIIESQKNMPIDLKEAIASVIFASPRCGDVPELLDIRKHLTAKYGKDFTSAAIELRPDCGVGRMLVEKLSAVAPDGQTKMKILSAIAEEYNVKWDPDSFTEKDSVPLNDMLTGPNNFEKASTLYGEPPRIQAPVVQATPGSNMHSSSSNVSQQDPRTSSGTENISFQNSGVNTVQPMARPPGDNWEHVPQKDSFISSLDRHGWNMEFKDAASAAQAAAESAERASIAARAAAELSNREKLTKQSSSESRYSDGRVLKDEGIETCGMPKWTGKQFSEDSSYISSSEETRLQNLIKPDNEKKSRSFKERRNEKKYVQSTSSTSKASEDSESMDHDDVLVVGLHSPKNSANESSTDDTKKYVQSSSLKSRASKTYESVDHNVPAVDANFQKNSKVSRGEISMKKQSFQFEAESTNDCPETFENFREEKFEKQPSVKSSLGDTKKYVQSPSKFKILKDYESMGHDIPAVIVRPQNSKVSRGEISMKEERFECEAESTNEWPRKSEIFIDEGIGKRPGVKSFRSNSSISDDVNVFAVPEDRTVGHDAVGMGSIRGEQSQTSYHESADAVFDKSDSDSDNGGLFMGTSNDDRGSLFHLKPQSPKHFTSMRDSWSSKTSASKLPNFDSPKLFSSRKNSFPDLSENSIAKDGSELDTHVKFDSDGPSSGSDDDPITSSCTVIEECKDLPNQQRDSRESDSSKFKENGYSGIGIKQSTMSSDDDLQSIEMLRERKQGRTGSPENLSLGKSAAHQPATRPEEFQIESEIDGGLNFGKLTGGFRQKGYNRPPYSKNRYGGLSSSKKEAKETNAYSIISTSPPADESPKISTILSHRKSNRTPLSSSDTDSDSSEEEEYLPKISGHGKVQFAPSSGGQVKIKTGLKAPNSVFGSDNSDLDEDVPKGSHTKKSHLQSGISRRTKASPSSSKPISYMKTRIDEPETFDSERGSPISYISEIPLESESQRKKSTIWENYERPTSAKIASVPAKSSLWASPELPPSEKATHVASHESKTQLSNERKHVHKQRKESKTLDYDGTEEPNPSTSITYEAPREFEPKMNSKEEENRKRPAPVKEATKPDKPSLWAPPEQHKLGSKPSYSGKLETPEQPKSEKSTSTLPHKSKISHVFSASEPPSSPQTKTEASASSENPKASNLNRIKSNNSGSPQNAGHVHPKLPDYDSLVQALRKNCP